MPDSTGLCATGNGLHTTQRPRCATPSKVAYRTRDDALAFNKRVASAGGLRLRAYKCKCGRWHLTHMTKRAARETGVAA